MDAIFDTRISPISELKLPWENIEILGQVLLRAAQKSPLTGALYVSGNEEAKPIEQNYPDLLTDAQHILGGLRSRGLCPGDNVGLLLESAADFVPAFWGCVLGGYVPCPLVAIRQDPARWEKYLAQVAHVLEDPFVVTTRALSDDLADLTSLSTATIDSLRRSAIAEPLLEELPDETAVLVLTSGSTGQPKAVMLTHRNLLAALSAKVERQGLTEQDCTLNWVSFDHVAALIETHLLPVYVGARQVHIDSSTVLADPLLFLRMLSRYAVSMTFSPNFLIGHIVNLLQSAKHRSDEALFPNSLDFSRLHHIVSGGEANVTATGRRFLDLLAPYKLARTTLWPAFGMTETCAGSIYSVEFPEYDGDREFASVGRPVMGLEMRITDAEGQQLPEGESGELELRGPMVFKGYLNNEVANRESFTVDGWFRTGDLGRIDDGHLHLVGRSKDSIIVNGVNYYSQELEAALEPIEGVDTSFVAAFPFRPRGAETEQLAVAIATPYLNDREAELHRLIIAIRNSTIMLWGFRPSLILPLPQSEFLKTSLGKIQRSLLRKRLEAGELAEHQDHVAAITTRQLGGHSAPVGAVETVIANIFAQMFNVEPDCISATASFFDLGGTSLEILQLKRNVEQRLGCGDIPIITIIENPTARALGRVIESGEGAVSREYDPIVPLQLSGSRTPLFCVHPGVGEILVFVNLAKYFVNERPFYALRARGFNEGEQYFTRFDEMVSAYVEGIRKRQPHGPYAIAGYSYGGAVAFEIAKVLESQGERVPFVGSFNLPPHIKYRMDELDEVEGAVNLAFFLSLIDKTQSEQLPAQLRANLPHQDPHAYLIENAPAERLAQLDIDLPKFKAWANLAQSLLTMGRSYAPSGSVESMSVFYATPLRGTKQDWLNNELRRWDDYTRSPNHYIDVAGEHYTLMGQKHVGTFQAVLRAELDRALGGA